MPVLPALDSLGTCGNFQQQHQQTCLTQRSQQEVRKRWNITDATHCNFPLAETKKKQINISSRDTNGIQRISYQFWINDIWKIENKL